jgi:hypothetical protein
MNGEKSDNKTPNVQERLPAGITNVEITKPGYHLWQRHVNIQPGRTTYATAILFAQTSPIILSENAANQARSQHIQAAPTLPDTLSFLQNGTTIELYEKTLLGDTLLAVLPNDTYTPYIVGTEDIVLLNTKMQPFVIDRKNGGASNLETTIISGDWNDQERMLVWTDGNEILSYDAQTKTKTLLTRQSEAIINVLWYAETQAVLIQTAHSVSAIETALYNDGRMVTTLTTDATHLSDMWLDSSAKILFIQGELTDVDNNNIFKLNLVR